MSDQYRYAEVQDEGVALGETLRYFCVAQSHEGDSRRRPL